MSDICIDGNKEISGAYAVAYISNVEENVDKVVIGFSAGTKEFYLLDVPEEVKVNFITLCNHITKFIQEELNS